MAKKLQKSPKTEKKLNISSQTNRMKDALLAELAKYPIIQIACQRIGVGRSTFYKWHKEDKKFAALADLALTEGKKFTNDMAESQLIKAIGNGNTTSIIYWLKNNHPDYADKIRYEHRYDVKIESEISEEESMAIAKALTHIGLANTIKKSGIKFTDEELLEAEKMVTASKLRDGNWHYMEKERWDRINVIKDSVEEEEQTVAFVPPVAPLFSPPVRHGKPDIQLANLSARIKKRKKEEAARLKALREKNGEL